MKKKVVAYTGMAALAVILDQLTKLFVRSFMEVGDKIEIIKGFFSITYSLNDGMAFGMAGNARWLFMILTPVLLVLLTVYFHFFQKEMGMLGSLSLGMIFGGGISNMIDRIFFIHLDETSTGLFDGRVVDFLDFHGIWNAIFNVADSFVVVGVFLFLLDFLLSSKKEKKQTEKARGIAVLEDSSETKTEEIKEEPTKEPTKEQEAETPKEPSKKE